MKQRRGFTLIEVVIGTAVITTGILIIIGSFMTYVKYSLSNKNNVEASYLAEEGIEVMHYLRDKDWANIKFLPMDTAFYEVWNGSDWATTTVPQTIDGIFVRTINISDVAGNDDNNKKKVTAKVDYLQGGVTSTVSMSTYLANIK